MQLQFLHASFAPQPKTPVVVTALWVEPRHWVHQAGWVSLLGWIIRIETGTVHPLPSMFLVPPTKTKKQCWTHLPSWKALNKPFVATTQPQRGPIWHPAKAGDCWVQLGKGLTRRLSKSLANHGNQAAHPQSIEAGNFLVASRVWTKIPRFRRI